MLEETDSPRKSYGGRRFSQRTGALLFSCDVCIVAVRILRNYRSPAVRTFLLGLLPLDGNTAAAEEALRDYPDDEAVSALKRVEAKTGLHFTVVVKARESLAFIERQ
jgi:hypothetical protein